MSTTTVHKEIGFWFMSDSSHSVVICYSLCPYEILPLDDKTKYTCMEEMNGWDDERE